MVARTAAELREAAEEFRSLAAGGEDLALRDALLLVADEFEQEAARVEAIEAAKASDPK
jgi:hypothetical protein